LQTPKTPKTSRKPGLNARQRAFVSEYLKDKNGKQAAIRAGYAKTTAEAQAGRLLACVGVRAAIEAAFSKLEKRNEDLADKVIRELSRIALSDIRDHFAQDGKLLPPHLLSDDSAAAVASLESEERFDRAAEMPFVVKKIKLWPKVEALRTLCDHLGLTRQRVEVSGQVTSIQVADPYAAKASTDDEGQE
jgi:phage terminase small subunit